MFVPPGRLFLLGTEEYGRDRLSRLLYGARVSLYVGLLAVGLGITSGALLGLVSGYFRGKTDFLLQRLMDWLMAFPTLVLALAIVSAQSPLSARPYPAARIQAALPHAPPG
jgi:peptide/nickel transport system permease protein